MCFKYAWYTRTTRSSSEKGASNSGSCGASHCSNEVQWDVGNLRTVWIHTHYPATWYTTSSLTSTVVDLYVPHERNTEPPLAVLNNIIFNNAPSPQHIQTDIFAMNSMNRTKTSRRWQERNDSKEEDSHQGLSMQAPIHKPNHGKITRPLRDH